MAGFLSRLKTVWLEWGRRREDLQALRNVALDDLSAQKNLSPHVKLILLALRMAASAEAEKLVCALWEKHTDNEVQIRFEWYFEKEKRREYFIVHQPLIQIIFDRLLLLSDFDLNLTPTNAGHISKQEGLFALALADRKIPCFLKYEDHSANLELANSTDSSTGETSPENGEILIKRLTILLNVC